MVGPHGSGVRVRLCDTSIIYYSEETSAALAAAEEVKDE